MLIGRHDFAQFSKLWKDQPKKVVEVVEDVCCGDGTGKIERVNVEISWVAMTLIPKIILVYCL